MFFALLTFLNSLQAISDIVKFFLMQNLSINSAINFGKIGIIQKSLEDFNITINPENIRAHILNAASQMYKLIADETRDTLISIMFDSASRNNRHVFGVNIRYIYEGKLRERVLGVLTQRNRQFGSILASQIRDLLAKIDKTVEDVYVSCTDNGKNMIKTSNIIIEAQKDLNLIQLISDEGILFIVKSV